MQMIKLKQITAYALQPEGRARDTTDLQESHRQVPPSTHCSARWGRFVHLFSGLADDHGGKGNGFEGDAVYRQGRFSG